jgi:hypothetical protein
MASELTHPLSAAGFAELLREMDAPPADTPERRMTFARARAARPLVLRAIVRAVLRQG